VKNRRAYFFAIILGFFLLPCLIFAQEMGHGYSIQQQTQSTSSGARTSRISLEDELRRDLEKRKQEIEELSQFIPLEGAVDEKTYTVGPGDQFAIGIAGSIEERFIVPVGADGNIVLPYIQAVEVAGKTLKVAQKEIIEQLQKVFLEEDISVSLVATRIFLVHVTGKVALPGAYTVTAAYRLQSAIELAGGYISTSDLTSIKIIRADDTLHTDLSRYFSSGDITQNPFLRDGDIIVVPGYSPGDPWIYISGAGEFDGLIPLKEDEGLLTLIGRVGADRNKLDFSGISLSRDGERFFVNLLDSEQRVPLQSRDSVFLSVMPDSVYVGGRVLQGGSKPFVPGADYSAYVAMAGGIAKEGSWDKVRIIRGGEKMRPSKAGEIRRGDVVMVGTSSFYTLIESLKALGEIASFATAVYVIGFRD